MQETYLFQRTLLLSLYREMVFWHLHPVVGQIFEKDVTIIFECVEDNLPLVIRVYTEEDYRFLRSCEIITEESGVTKITLTLPDYVTYVLEWTYKDLVLYRHKIALQHPAHYLFLSCDFLEADTSPSLWEKVKTERTDSVLVHLGDQIYADAEFREGVRAVKKDCGRRKVLDFYRQRYRMTWKRCHEALSNVSNLFLWDDHELVNDYCISSEHTPEEAIVASVATDAYKEYQLACHREDNIEGSFVRGLVSVLTIERTAHAPSVEKILARLHATTTPKVFLCFASGPIPKPHGNFGSIYRFMTGEPEEEEGKFWSCKDLLQLYTGICDWLQNNAEKDVVVVGGDLHFGTYGRVSRGLQNFQVIVASPISNHPSHDRHIASLGMAGLHQLGNGVVFETVVSKAQRCYARVSVDNHPCRVEMVWNPLQNPHSRTRYYKQLLRMR
jgi:hypothetical protein